MRKPGHYYLIRNLYNISSHCEGMCSEIYGTLLHGSERNELRRSQPRGDSSGIHISQIVLTFEWLEMKKTNILICASTYLQISCFVQSLIHGGKTIAGRVRA